MQYFLCVFLLLFTFSASGQISQAGNNRRSDRNMVIGNGELTTQNRTVSKFDEITACCKIRVEIVQGDTQVLRVEAESNLLSLIKTEVSGDRLNIYFDGKTSFRSRNDVVVYVTIPSVVFVGGKAGADIVIQSTFEGSKLALDASSGAVLEARFTGDQLEVEANSAGRVQIVGKSSFVRANASSGGSVNAKNFATEIADADVSNGGQVEINISESLKANASSGGGINYRGTATSVSATTHSGGSVRKG